MNEGLLGRIGRHPQRPDRDEAEDRLTEIVAALLAHAECRGLAQFVACGWLEDAVAEGTSDRGRLEALLTELRVDDSQLVRVTTQIHTSAAGRRRRPDLALVFGAPNGEVTLWVEVKHGTQPHSGQLADYLVAQKERGITRGAVLLVAPRDDYPSFPAAELPETVPQLTWQRTAARLRAYPAPGPVAAFLVDELCTYLREEQLMDPPRLTLEHFAAFEFHVEAFAALDPICAVADARVSQEWDPHPDYGHDYHGSYRRNESRRRQEWWMYRSKQPVPGVLDDWMTTDWCLFLDSRDRFPDRRVGVPTFTAGASGEPGALARLPPDVGEELSLTGFQLLSREMLRHEKYDRIWRCAYPNEVLTGESLEEQGDALAKWIVTSFEDLYRICG